MNYVKHIKDSFEGAMADGYKVFEKQNIVRKRLNEATNVVFFGTGEFFEDCYGHPGVDFDYVCDNDEAKWGKLFKGKECLNIEQVKQLEDCAVLIMVGNYKPIREQLNQHGIENYCCDEIFLNVYDHHYDKKWFEDNLGKAIKALELWEDDQSKEIYVEAIANRIYPQNASKIFDELKTPGEYFGTDVLQLDSEEYLVDAGAFNGDSALSFIEAVKGKFGHIYAFELEEQNYYDMKENLYEYREKITLYNYGVWDASADVAFRGGEYNSHIEEESEQGAKVIKIDDALKGKKVTFIKMDVEGAEIRALRGAETIICEQKPKMAISAYHYLSDLWEVPILIKTLQPEYKLQLRHHAPTVWDTDCYAYV